VGSGNVDIGNIGTDAYAYIPTVEPFHGNQVAVYNKNVEADLVKMRWKELNMQVNLLLIAFLLLIYSVGSFVLLFITSQGWPVLAQIYSAPLFLVPTFISIVGRFFRAGAYIPMELLWTYLKLIVITLIVVILFNLGGCGDAGRGGYFYETILAGKPGRYCALDHWSTSSLFVIARLAYHGVLIAFAIYIAFIAKRS